MRMDHASTPRVLREMQMRQAPRLSPPQAYHNPLPYVPVCAYAHTQPALLSTQFSASLRTPQYSSPSAVGIGYSRHTMTVAK